MDHKLSVVIITFNEEKNIGRCIDSVLEIADDIVVVDSFSTDRTQEICQEKGVRFFQNKWGGYSDQKNYANSLALYDWIFSIDADEALSKELKKSISETKQGPYAPILRICRITNYCGKWIQHGGWYPDVKVRFFDRRQTYWEGLIHERLCIQDESAIPVLKGDCYHYSYYSLEGHWAQALHFSELAASALFDRNKKAGLLKLWFSPLVKFIRMYLIRLGLLDGKEGFTIARISSYAVFYKYTRLRQLFKADKINKSRPRIIISRTDNIGDVVLALPMAGVIKKALPDSYIMFMGKPYTQEIIKMSQCVDEFIDWEAIRKGSEQEQIQSFQNLKADYIIHAFPLRQIAVIAKKAGIPNRIGTTGRAYHWLNCNQLILLTRRRSKLHESQLNLKLLKTLGINRRFSLKEIANNYKIQPPQSLPDKYRDLIKKDKFNLILHPKSKGSAREWGIDKYSELISSLPDKFNIFISGTAEDTEIIQKELISKHPSITDLSGKLTLPEFISFIAIADGMVACSTGPLHIEAALDKYAIGIYPPIRPMHPGRWAPVGSHASYLVSDKKCSKCRNSGKCECIDEITPEMVKNRLMEIVKP